MSPLRGLVSRGLMRIVQLVLLAATITRAMDCNENQVEVMGTRCCSICQPGEGVVSSCTDTSDTSCQPCELGSTYSSRASEIESCARCTNCGDNSRVISPCNRTHDTQCECNEGYFMDSLRNLCRTCDLCPIGHGSVTECTRVSNVRCRRCPNGTFSDRRSRTCVPCGVCGFHQLILRPCSNLENTICIDIPLGQITAATPEVTEETLSVVYDDESTHKRDVLPIYCSVLGLVLLGLIIYVIVMHVRKKAAQKQSKQVPCVHEAEIPRATKQGSDSGVCVEQDTKYALLSSRVRDLPSAKMSQLEAMLMVPRDGRDDWRGLALEIGYTPDNINNFELWADQSQSSPAGYFMDEWSQNETATVGALLRVLRTLRREDVVRMLQSDWLPREPPRMMPSNQEPLLL